VGNPVIDNTASQENGGTSNNFIQVDANSNTTLEFLPQFQRLKSILRGCDMDETVFEGVRITVIASYESVIVNSARSSAENITEVGGSVSLIEYVASLRTDSG
jgi:hypothetical protein